MKVSSKWEDGKLVMIYEPKVEGHGKKQTQTREIKDEELILVSVLNSLLIISCFNFTLIFNLLLLVLTYLLAH